MSRHKTDALAIYSNRLHWLSDVVVIGVAAFMRRWRVYAIETFSCLGVAQKALTKTHISDDGRRFWVSAHDCQLPSPTSRTQLLNEIIKAITEVYRFNNYRCLYAPVVRSTGRLLSNLLNFICDWPPGDQCFDDCVVLM